MRHVSMKSVNFLDHFFDLSLGGGFRGMRKRARIGCMSHRAGTQKRDHQSSWPYLEAKESLL